MGRCEGPVAEIRPGRDLERLEIVSMSPLADLRQRPAREAGREESELHDASSVSVVNDSLRSTSTHPRDDADRSTASVIAAARAPSANVGRPSTGSVEPAATAAYVSATN